MYRYILCYQEIRSIDSNKPDSVSEHSVTDR